MQSTGKGGSRIEVNSEDTVYSVLFAQDGEQVLGGGAEGMLRRWRVRDGDEEGEPIHAGWAEIFACALSPDQRWLVYGLRRPDLGDGEARATVWNAQSQEKVLDIKDHTNTVFSVDFFPDSTKFATGSADQLAFIWSITTGQRLVGPLQHDGWVVAVRFSPIGDRIATVAAETDGVAKSIRIYNSDNGQQLLDIPFRVKPRISSSLAWSADASQLFAASYSEVKRFDASSGSLIAKWSVPGGGSRSSVVLSRSQKFAVVAAYKSISFWDISTHQQIGTAIQHTSDIWSIALSPDDDYLATGEQNGKVTLQSLREILPVSYLAVNVTSQLPFMYIYDATFKSWKQDNLTRAEELLTEEITLSPHCSRALAQRSLVRSRLKQWNGAIEDAKKSIEAQRSVIGYIANAVALAGNGDYEASIRLFDIVFTDSLATDNNFLLLVKAIILFECGNHYDAILRVNNLIDIVDDRSMYIAVGARMFLLYGGTLLREGDDERGLALLRLAREANPFQASPHLLLISLIFGWNFEDPDLVIRMQLQESIKELEERGDAAVQSNDPKAAIVHYSAALSLIPSNPMSLLVKRSKAQAILGSWEEALKDADEAIEADPASPWGYERRHAALHALQRYDEAVDSFTRMLSLIEGSVDQKIRQQRKKYVSPSLSEKFIHGVISGILKIAPLVLIDVESGHLCDGLKRIHTFKSEPQFKELVSSITKESDHQRVQQVVEKYFRYVTHSHVWEGKEPSFQDVNLAGSIWELDSSPLNGKLRKFCEVVRTEGYRWAWSDTCCIDKTISTVLNQSLAMMYKWYEASAATFVHLSRVPSPSALGDLTGSIWMTRAWTAQELLAPRVIRFYTSDWKPYLGDTRSNHKESPEIMQELADAIGISRETIISFNPNDLSVREKLRLASSRHATMEEDVAYSLIGIFKSDIRPHYGEGDAALGHLLEEIVARSGEVTVLAWYGKSSSYNSCLPATLEVYSQPPGALTAIDDADMDAEVAKLRGSLSRADAAQIFDQVTRLPSARFANRRLHLPCVIFTVRKLVTQYFKRGGEFRYRAQVSGIGPVEFRTSHKLPTSHRLFVVHPWIRDLCDPPDGFTWRTESDYGSCLSSPVRSPRSPVRLSRRRRFQSDGEEGYSSASVRSLSRSADAGSAPSTPSDDEPPMDDYMRALRMVVRLRRPFHALLLQRQPGGEFKRLATEHEIVVPGIEPRIDFARDVRATVIDVL